MRILARQVPNKTKIHRLVTKFRGTGSVGQWQVLIKRQTAEIMALPISSSASAATTGYGCKNSI
jgi:hypothetical protein